MSPTIRIDEEVFEELKKHAEPFVDTPNSVLRRLLGLGETGRTGAGRRARREGCPAGWRSPTPAPARSVGAAQGQRPPRAKTGSILPETAYELPMLEIIASRWPRGGPRGAGRARDAAQRQAHGGGHRARLR